MKLGKSDTSYYVDSWTLYTCDKKTTVSTNIRHNLSSLVPVSTYFNWAHTWTWSRLLPELTLIFVFCIFHLSVGSSWEMAKLQVWKRQQGNLPPHTWTRRGCSLNCAITQHIRHLKLSWKILLQFGVHRVLLPDKSWLTSKLDRWVSNIWQLVAGRERLLRLKTEGDVRSAGLQARGGRGGGQHGWEKPTRRGHKRLKRSHKS